LGLNTVTSDLGGQPALESIGHEWKIAGTAVPIRPRFVDTIVVSSLRG